MRILLADDHTLFRIALKNLLASMLPGAWIKDVENGQRALEVIKLNVIDILILDIAMPTMDGFELINHLKKTKTKAFKILALTNYTETAIVHRLLQLGVEGYLPKSVDDNIFMEALTTLKLGGIYYFEKSPKEISSFISRGDIPNFKLSKNELQILKLLANGKSSKEIANFTGYTVKSVETKRFRIARKLFAKNTEELVSKAIKLGLLDATN